MDVAINNSTDLNLEITRLQGVKSVQEAAIKQHFNSPQAILGTITSIIRKKDNQTFAGNDITAWLSKTLLPLTLDKTVFRKSGFVVRALVRLLSRKASSLINDKNMTPLWDKIKGILPEAIVEKISPKKKRSFLRLLPAKTSK